MANLVVVRSQVLITQQSENFMYCWQRGDALTSVLISKYRAKARERSESRERDRAQRGSAAHRSSSVPSQQQASGESLPIPLAIAAVPDL